MNLKIFNFYYPVRNVIFFLGEIILIFLSLFLVSYFKISIIDANFFDWKYIVLKSFFVTGICVLVLYYLDMYNFSRAFKFSELIFKLIQGLGIVCIVLFFMFFLRPNLVITEDILIYSTFVIILIIPLWRIVYNWLLKNKKLTKKVLFIGFDEIAQKIKKELDVRNDYAFEIIGIVKEKNTDSEKSFYNKAKLKLQNFINSKSLDLIVIALKEKRGRLPLDLLVELKVNGIGIQSASNFYEKLTGRLIVENIAPGYIIFNEGFASRPLQKGLKRIFDVFLAFIGLTLSIPILIIFAIAIKLESKGPVFYKQVRVGEKEKEFVIYKLRSMRNDAEKDKPIWAQKDDPRITRVGKFIRKTRIDEIPQMWNVLKGDMSFVGPRPERPFFVKDLKKKIPFYNQRHAVKPGITGWAQIRYPYGSSFEDALEKLKYDLYYIKNFSLLFDLAILFETTRVVFLKKGAR